MTDTTTRPTVVLLHGVGLDHTMWEPVTSRLADAFDVVAPDLPGHGTRPPAAAGTTLADLAAGVGERVPQGSHLVGFSLGALVVFAAWALDLGVAVRAASGFLFFLGFTGIFQARASTCVALASRGFCDMDEGPEAIGSDAEVAALRAQARSVLLRSAIAALIVTVAAVLVRQREASPAERTSADAGTTPRSASARIRDSARLITTPTPGRMIRQ